MSSTLYTLVEVLRLLAMQPDEQANALPDFVDVPDELALLFGEQCDVLSEAELESGLGNAGASLVHEIDRILTAMAGKDEYYSMNALRNRAEWRNIRELSQQALASMGLSVGQPDLSWVTYVRGS